MGIYDRGYMQSGSEGRSRGRPPTLLERLRFWWWRVCQRLRGAGPIIVVGATLWALPMRGQEFEFDEEWITQAVEMGSGILENLEPEELQAQYGAMRDEWAVFWGEVQGALGDADLEELARLDPYARDALEWMDAVPPMAPLADWLRQRVDYFDAAAELVPDAVRPVPRPPPELTPRGSGTWRSWLHLPPKKIPEKTPKPKPAASASAQQVDYWKRKLGTRVVPAGRQVVIPRLKEIFREEGVPADLVWMAETESTLNPAARSPAGAAGLFQFMPATAGRFGLKLAPRDERLEPEKSARAAAKYLKFLNGEFNDWPLAIAAYNAGEGRVGKALKRGGGKTFENAAPHLPAETRMYVPKVLATIALREGREFDGG